MHRESADVVARSDIGSKSGNELANSLAALNLILACDAIALACWSAGLFRLMCVHAEPSAPLRSEELYELLERSSITRYEQLEVAPPSVKQYFADVTVTVMRLDEMTTGVLYVLGGDLRSDANKREANTRASIEICKALVRGQTRVLELQQTNARLADFALASGDWFWETTPEHILTWTSLDLSKHGTGKGRPNEVPLGTYVHMETGDLTVPLREFGDLLAARQPFSRAVLKIKGAAALQYLSFSGVPVFQQNTFLGFRGTTRDVTSRVEAEQGRQKSSRALARITSEVPGLVCELLIRPNGTSTILYANQRMEDIFGPLAAELRDDPSRAFEWIHPDDLQRVSASLDEAARSAAHWRGEYRIRLPGQRERVIAGQATPELQADGSTAWYVVATDVTKEAEERKQAEVLRLERDDAKRLERLRADLTARVSHELRTPLNAILGFAQLLRATYPDFEVEPGRSLRHVHQAANHLLAVINDMLDLAALEADRFQAKLTNVELRPLFANCSELMQLQATHRGIRLLVDVNKDAECALADERSVRQILLNLLSNAIKFSPQNGALTLGAALGATGEYVEIDVADFGDGIPVDRLDRLFAPFERLGADTRTPGTGLGLAISKQLARRMGGNLVHVPTSRGTCFRLTLRAGTEGAPTAAPSNFLPDVEFPPHQDVRQVLYVDDDPVNVLVMEGLLKMMPNVRMHAAGTGALGIQAAIKFNPDLILLDMQLSDISGLEVFQVLRQKLGAAMVPVIAVSADAMPHQIDAAIDAGFLDYITKPVELSRLREALHRLLWSRTADSHRSLTN